MLRTLHKFLFAALAVLLLTGAPDAFAQGSGKRANVSDVSKAVNRGEGGTYGPTNLPRPPATEDGRDLVYLDVVFITALRDNRPARLYSFWPRLTMATDASATDYYRNSAHVQDAMITALAQVAQIDWPGESKLDVGLASQLSKDTVNRALGGVPLDAIDFLHIEVQVF